MQDLERVARILKSRKYNVVILDEILSALKSKFIKEKDVLRIIGCNPKKEELILTGLSSTAKIIRLSDYVSHIKSVKHPFEKGIKARKGIEM